MVYRSAFVTGGTGFVGRNVLEELVHRGWDVTALHRATSRVSGVASLPIRLVEGDILDPDSLVRGIPEGVAVVFHLASDTSLWSRRDAWQNRVNVEGTRNVVEAAIRRGAGRVVHTSSWNAYGLWNGPISEEQPKRGRRSPVNYDRSKALAEDVVLQGIEDGLDAVILNPAHIIGRYDRKNWARMIVMTYRETLPGIPPGSGVFCHARDVARAHVVAAEKGRTGHNYLLGGEEATFMEVFEIVGELLDREVPSRPVPAWLFTTVGHLYALAARVTGREPDVTPEVAAIVTANPRIESDKAERELGYEPISLRAMLEDCVAWLEEEGAIELE